PAAASHHSAGTAHPAADPAAAVPAAAAADQAAPAAASHHSAGTAPPAADPAAGTHARRADRTRNQAAGHQSLRDHRAPNHRRSKLRYKPLSQESDPAHQQ